MIRAAGVVLAGREGRDGDGDGAFLRPDAERRRVEEGDRPDIGRFQTILPDDLVCRLDERFGRVRDRQVIESGRGVEALQVRVQPEHGRALGRWVAAHPLENAGAVVEGVRQHVNLRLAPGDELAVEPDSVDRCKSHSASIYRTICAHLDARVIFVRFCRS